MRVTVLSKPDCGLCDEAKEVVERVRLTVPFDLEVRDISLDPDLLREYGGEVPVVFIEGRKAFKYRVDECELLKKLGR